MQFSSTPGWTSSSPTTPSDDALSPVRLGDVLAPLSSALQNGHAWLEDFSNDEVLMPKDLLDVIHAFARLHPSS